MPIYLKYVGINEMMSFCSFRFNLYTDLKFLSFNFHSGASFHHVKCQVAYLSCMIITFLRNSATCHVFIPHCFNLQIQKITLLYLECYRMLSATKLHRFLIVVLHESWVSALMRFFFLLFLGYHISITVHIELI